MNIFLGARRLSYVIVAIIICTGISIAFSSDPTIKYNYVVSGVASSAIKHTGECGYDDYEYTDYLETPKGRSYRVNICFSSIEFPNGEMLIPYKESEAGTHGESKYSNEVREYAKRKSIPRSEKKILSNDVDSNYWISWIKHASKIVGTTCLIAIGFILFTVIIGWIVRGFVGIPSGADKRPAP